MSEFKRGYETALAGALVNAASRLHDFVAN